MSISCLLGMFYGIVATFEHGEFMLSNGVDIIIVGPVKVVLAIHVWILFIGIVLAIHGGHRGRSPSSKDISSWSRANICTEDLRQPKSQDLSEFLSVIDGALKKEVGEAR